MPPFRAPLRFLSPPRTLPRPLSRRFLSTTTSLSIRIKPTMHRKPPRTSSGKEPLPEDTYSSEMEMPTINVYEQDSDQLEPPTLIERIETWDELRTKRRAHEAEQIRLDSELMQAEENWDGTAADLPEETLVPLHLRIKTAEKEPEHREAMSQLKIPVMGWGKDRDAVSKVEGLNAALKMGYVGANRVVQRELWRAYLVARTVPGVLTTMPDAAWDMVYWSQASMPAEHPARERVMQVLEDDLRSAGRDGPPTNMMAEEATSENVANEDKEEEDLEDDDEAFEGLEELAKRLSSMGPEAGDAELEEALAEYGLELSEEEMEEWKKERQSVMDKMKARGHSEEPEEVKAGALDFIDHDVDGSPFTDKEMKELLSDDDSESLKKEYEPRTKGQR